MPEQALLLQYDFGPVRLITLNRPEKRNALNSALIEILLNALDASAQDPSITILVLAGAGKIFCSGVDMNEFRDRGSEQAALSAARNKRLLELLLGFTRYDKPIVAALHGAAIGAGAALIAAADMAVMGTDAVLSYPETKHGIIPGLMMGNLLHQIGSKPAFELLVAASPIDAPRALALGLVNRIVANEQVAALALELAGRLAELDLAVLVASKRLLGECARRSPIDALRHGHAESAKGPA